MLWTTLVCLVTVQFVSRAALPCITSFILTTPQRCGDRSGKRDYILTSNLSFGQGWGSFIWLGAVNPLMRNIPWYLSRLMCPWLLVNMSSVVTSHTDMWLWFHLVRHPECCGWGVALFTAAEAWSDETDATCCKSCSSWVPPHDLPGNTKLLLLN